MSNPHEVTNGELMRRLDEAYDRINSLSGKMDEVHVPRAVLDVKFAQLEERLEARHLTLKAELDDLRSALSIMQNWQQWAVRLIVGAIVTILVTAIYTGFVNR